MKNKKKLKLYIALIHNNDSKRNAYIKPSLKRLKKEISQYFDIEIIEESKQPKKLLFNNFSTLTRKYLYWKINREWKRYRKLKPRHILLDTFLLIVRLIQTYINREQENHRSAIEAFITDKHVRAWNFFLEKNADFLICFEDDVIFKEDSIRMLKNFLRDITNYIRVPIYLDFAGGCSSEILGAKNLEIKNDKFRKFYRKPTTNTICCYMINRKTAENFSLELLNRPWLRLVCGDWLVNKLFILTTPKYKYYCYHTDPPIFIHGSISGNYVSMFDRL